MTSRGEMGILVVWRPNGRPTEPTSIMVTVLYFESGVCQEYSHSYSVGSSDEK